MLGDEELCWGARWGRGGCDWRVNGGRNEIQLCRIGIGVTRRKIREGRQRKVGGRFDDSGEEPECDAGKRTENKAVSFASWKENGQ